ncbi:MAG TPA: hypothetical protein VFG59_07980 [Anaeromyxobacter sp.]|nr:hypothetical protein [Anaeromyxobacter sp.]
MGSARAVVVLCLGLVAAGCGGSGGGGTRGGDITISGQLSPGTVGSPLVEVPLSPLELYCVTFESPPAAGSAVADGSGNFTLTFAAQNVPFGCFLLRASDQVGVATLFFSSGSSRGETVTFSADADLGTVTYDVSSGMATAAIPAGGSLTTSTPADVPCPVGTWNVTIGPYTCDGSCTNGCTPGTTQVGTSTVWIVETSAGEYAASFTHLGCNSSSQANVTATFTGGVFTIGPWTEPGDTCTHSVTAAVTPDAACGGTTSGTTTWTNCGPCGTGDNVCPGCGENTCEGTIEGLYRN